MSGPNRHYQHVLRMAGLFVVGISLFFVLRAIFVPDDFGIHGHYRAAALEANRDLPLVHGGSAICADCHADTADARGSGPHARVACEGCHSPAARHASGDAEAPKPTKPDAVNGCLVCHARSLSRPPAFPQVVAAEHAGDSACTSCHNPHNPKVS